MFSILPHFEKFPRRITASVLGGSLLMTLGIVSILGFSVYRDLCHQAEIETLKQLEKHTRQISMFLQESIRAASEYRYIENSLKHGSELNQWWEPPSMPLASPSVPDIARVDLSRIKGIVHYKGNGQVSSPPPGIPNMGKLPRCTHATLNNIFYINEACTIAILFPGIETAAESGGLDLVFCDGQDLTVMLQNTADLGKHSHLSLIDAQNKKIRFLTPTRIENRDASRDETDNLLRKAVRISRNSVSSPWMFIDHPSGRLAVTQARILDSNWGVMLAVPSREMYAGARLKTFLMGGAATLLALFLSSLSLISVRPFANYFNRIDYLLTREREKRHRDARKLQVAQQTLIKRNQFRKFIYSLASRPADEDFSPEELEKALGKAATLFNAEKMILFHMPRGTAHAFPAEEFSPGQWAAIAKTFAGELAQKTELIIADTTSARFSAAFNQALEQLTAQSVAAAAFSSGAQQWALVASSSKTNTFRTKTIIPQLLLAGTLLVRKK